MSPMVTLATIFMIPGIIPLPLCITLSVTIEAKVIIVEVNGKNIELMPNKMLLESRNIPGDNAIGLVITIRPIMVVNKPTQIWLNRNFSTFSKDKDV